MSVQKRVVVTVTTVVFVALASWFHSEPARAAVTRNRLAANRLAANRLAANRLAANRLAANALSSTRLEANVASREMLATAEGQDLYAYLMSCALPDGVTIEATVAGAPDSDWCTGGHCQFPGGLGLAADWIDHKLAAKDERWVSACIFARVNAFDTAKGISLRGAHPNLAVTLEEWTLYKQEEGAFYGNLFTHEDDPIDVNACRGRDQADGSDLGNLGERVCAKEDPAHPGQTMCGFTYAGDCASYTPASPTPYACRRVDDQGNYNDCHATAGSGRWPGATTYREVITVYVSQ